MKKIACSLMITLLMGVSVNSFAQKSMAIINSQTSKQAVDGRIAVITFQLDNISTEQQKQIFVDSFSSNKGIFETSAALLSGGMASFSMKMLKTESAVMLQNIFMTAGIEKVSVDGTIMPVNELVEYLKALKAKK